MQTYGTEVARGELFTLVAADAPTEITREGHGRLDRAQLVPVGLLTEEQQTTISQRPGVGLTEARRRLGDLVAQAAGGEMQVLHRRGKPIAVLISTEREVEAAPGVGAPAPRRLQRAEDVDLLTSAPAGAHYGLADIDELTGGLVPGSLSLIAAAPGVGGSLLAAGAARATAVVDGRPVLYAAVGPTAADVVARVGAAHAGVPYRGLRAAAIDPIPTARAALDEVRDAPLYVDDGADLDIATLTGVIPDIEDLALLVVDRLQATDDPEVPLSGAALPAATRQLLRLARAHRLPILAAVDTTDPAVLSGMRADVVLHLERTGSLAQLTACDGDFGAGGDEVCWLQPDFARARFVDALPPQQMTSVRRAGAPEAPHASSPSPSAEPGPTGRQGEVQPPAEEALPRPVARSGAVDEEVIAQVRLVVEEALAAAEGDADAALAALKKKALPHVLAWWDRTRKGSRYEHSSFPPTADVLKKAGQKSGADAIWEGRPSWRNPALTDVSEQEVEVDALDANAAYLSAFKTFLPIGQLQPDDDLVHDPKRAGIYRITPPTWEHQDLPSPLGDRKKKGEVWVSEPTMRLLQRCAKEGLAAAPVIHEAWTSGGTETLLEKLRRTLAEVRRQAVAAGDDVTTEFVKDAYSKFISTMGESSYNRELRRPDWMHILRAQAFANLWLKARRAHQAGLTVVKATGTDELHVAGDWRRLWAEGRDLSQMKVKEQYTLGGDQ